MIFYQIYPLSFRDSDGDGAGDIPGIIEKLDYLDHSGDADSLGVDGIWLCPFYKSPLIDGGYDITDFRSVHPIFGTMADFEKLVSEVHRRGMKIIIDFVANHTSNEHPWFLESRENKVNEKRDWYVWRDPKPDGSPPNNWLSVFGGSAWAMDNRTGQYYLHNFLKSQPDLNWRNSEVRKAMMAILEFWMGRGVDGFRVDSLHHFIEDLDMRDDPPNPLYLAGKQNPYRALRHKFSKGDSDFRAGGDFLSEFFKKYPEVFVVSEAYAGVEEMKKMYASVSSKNYMPFNFNLATLPWRAEKIKKFVDDYENALAPSEMPNYVIGNHDMPRVVSRLDHLRARSSALLQFCLRGMVFIYYGEELGMENVPVSKERVRDPFELNVPGLDLGRDPARTPMHWSAETNAGFSDSEAGAYLWLPISGDYKKINVENELRDPHSVLSLYRMLIGLRRKYAALESGKYVPRESRSKDVFSFMREAQEGGSSQDKHERFLIFINFGTNEVFEPTEKIAAPAAVPEIICNSTLDRVGEKVLESEIKLRPYEACLVKI